MELEKGRNNLIEIDESKIWSQIFWLKCFWMKNSIHQSHNQPQKPLSKKKKRGRFF